MSAATTPFESQTRLWLVAFAVSALVNLIALSAIAFWVLAKIALQSLPRDPVTSTGESVAVIMPEMIESVAGEPAPAAPVVPPPAPPPDFARTSPDQVEATPDRPDFIGERSTQATSDTTPAPMAPDQISQKGRDPLYEDEVETTRSNYQDGDLAHDRKARIGEPAPAESKPAPMTPHQDNVAEAAKRDGELEAEKPPAEATREQLAEGPSPVERRVKEAKPEDETKPAQPERRADGQKPEEKPAAEQPKQAAANANAPGFRGNQVKTKLVGSITRSGRSALNVEDSVLGRYHAAVSRAVEKEWQLNCVRNRDYITPGMLTMSFMLDAKGKVREIRVVEDLQVGAIPKGFTLNAINDAEIPVMPADLKKQLNGEPLELIYRFSF
ncbi:hypothetical protein OKA05_23210 [Luteolibacter arcticus]|uniref:TonB C-terminal domain-containing protein n=1 Tax=Luteolibacter arcticus TaxID=1581411 RepID=A0ABT3GPM8_9BACT|nr:hypothetical protein [Luteolibacter arcticus]MCW1925486.1 hypothetical protein [Luteolibacter arcticus]